MKIYYFYLSKLLNLATGVLLLWWGFLFGLFVGVVLFFFFLIPVFFFLIPLCFYQRICISC